MSRIEWVNCPKCGHRMQRGIGGELKCSNCEYPFHVAYSEKNYEALADLRGEEILELRANVLRLGWQLAIAKTRLRLIRKNAEFLRKTHVEYPGLWREFDEIVDLVDGTSTELESEIGLDGQPHRLDESEIERRRAWKPY